MPFEAEQLVDAAGLTPRQRAILEGLSCGQSYAQIGAGFSISQQAVWRALHRPRLVALATQLNMIVERQKEEAKQRMRARARLLDVQR